MTLNFFYYKDHSCGTAINFLMHSYHYTLLANKSTSRHLDPLHYLLGVTDLADAYSE